MKKILFSLLTIMAAAVPATAATYAYFTSQVVLGTNTVNMGKLSIRLGQATQAFTVNGLAPGVWSAPYSIRIVNDDAAGSTLGATLKASAAYLNGDGNTYNNLNLIVRDSTDNVTFYSGLLKDFSDKNLSTGPLLPGAFSDYKVYVQLPPDAGNAFQGKSTGFNLVFVATQLI